VSGDEITAVVGRSVVETRQQVDGLCSWIFAAKPGEPAGTFAYAWLRPWPSPIDTDVDLFRGNLAGMPQSAHENVGEGAYWSGGTLSFLLEGRVYETEIDDASLGDDQMRAISVAIAKAAIPRM
jgi:hypothetical protein